MSVPAATEVLHHLWRTAGQPAAALDHVMLPGAEPVLPSSFAVGTAAQTTIAAASLAAAELWRLRTGNRQHVSVDMRHAAIEFRSEHYLRIDGKPVADHRDKIAGLYRCGDGRWVRAHTNLPHHRAGLLELLGCEHDRAAVQRAMNGWEARSSRPQRRRPALCSPPRDHLRSGTSIRRAAQWPVCRRSSLSG